MKVNNMVSSNPLTIANAFNNYFSSAAENLIKNFPANNNGKFIDPLTFLQKNFSHPSLRMKLNNTTTHEIDKLIQSMKCKNSYGYNEISSTILKSSAPYVLSPLTFIFNKILSSGVFPERLKLSEVNPLYKKGDSSVSSNYRPISI